MSFILGIRMALAGGRESIARIALMALGIMTAVVLLLLSLTALPVLQGHIDRLAWHRTTAESPATAPDPALWLAVTDRYAGRDIIRVNVAALGPKPPVPPGVDRLPGPGEVIVSPALAELMRSVPADQLRDRFPGQITGAIGPQGLIAPTELVGIVGRSPEEMRKIHGAYEIRGIEQPGERLDFYAVYGVLFTLLAMLIIGPVVVFISMVTRIGGARRDLRFAALRLAGASRLQTAVFAAIETVGAAVVGVLLGWLAFLASLPTVASFVTLGHGMPIFQGDLHVPPGRLVFVLLAVPLLAGATTLVSLHPVQITPLSVRMRARRRPPRAWRLLPLAIGIAGIWYTAKIQDDPANTDGSGAMILGVASLLFPLSVVVGLFLAGSWICMWISRGLARVSSGAATLIVARRIAADPYSTFRAVSGAALAMFVATVLGLTAAQDRETHHEVSSVLNHGVVAVHVQGAPEASLAPLMTPGVVVARAARVWEIVVDCAELSRVANVSCPLPEYPSDQNSAESNRAESLFALPYLGVSSADFIFRPRKFTEPDREMAGWPIQTLFIPTDGTLAAQERVRTLAATVAPLSRSKTSEDLAGQTAASPTGVDTVLPAAMVFVLLVAACSLTVSVVNGVMERRRPFALLRASGVRLGQLRRIVLLETGVPLLATVLGGVGVAMLTANAAAPPSEWLWPTGGFFAGLGIGLLAAFAVSSIALAYLDVATRLDSARYE